MGILNPIAANFAVAEGVTQLVYSCPAGKSHAIVDLSFYKDNDADSTIQIALSTGNAGSLTSVDFFLDDVVLIGTNRNAELTKVVVGPNENLYVKLVEGSSNVRVSGIEEANPKVGKAGRMSAGNIAAANTQTKIYENATTGAAYAAASITLFNSSLTVDAIMDLWVTNSATPGTPDKIMHIPVVANDTLVLENITLLPTEKLYVQSDQANTEFYVNGLVVIS